MGWASTLSGAFPQTTENGSYGTGVGDTDVVLFNSTDVFPVFVLKGGINPR